MNERQRQIVSGYESRSRRRGVALLMVLTTITVALALSYAMLRSQTTQLIVQQNGSRTLDARQAAIAGMNLALQKMHDSSWGGIDSTLSDSLDADSSYSVTFATGDASLAEGDADYGDYPYRVTLLSTGTATDSASGVSATHQVQAVVQLIPRQLSDEPTNWDTVNQHVLYQWGNSDVQIDLPNHIDGPVYLNGSLELAQNYPFDANPFDGTIDEVAIYNDTYASNEVNAVYKAVTGSGSYSDIADAYGDKSPISWWRFDDAAGSSSAIDQTGSHNGQYVEADAYVPGVDSSTAAQFDGVDDYVDVGSIDITSGDKMTIFAWFKADSFSDGYSMIVSKATAQGDTDHYWTLATRTFSGQTRLMATVRTNFGQYAVYDQYGGNLVAGQWYFAAVVVDGTSFTLYKNGSYVGYTNISGTIRQQPYATVFIGDDAPGSSRAQYLRDLNRMQADGLADERPFTGPVSLPVANAAGNSISHLQDNLTVTVNDVTPDYSAAGTFPDSPTTYQLYTGGKQYTIETLSSYLSSASKGPDTLTNPLGVYLVSGDAYVTGNVKIEGTLLLEESSGSGGSIDLQGTGNEFSAVDLPALYGTTEPVQLPVMIAENDVVSRAANETTIEGMVWAGDTFQQSPKVETGVLEIEGRIVANEVQLQGNSYWSSFGESIWQDAVAQFRLLKYRTLDLTMYYIADWSFFMYQPDESFDYLPELMETALASDNGMMDPALTLKAESTPVSYHWHDWTKPIFVPHPDDGGLRWDLIDWTDNP